MAFNAFLDANVILDHTLKREGFNETRQLFQLTVEGQLNTFTSSSIIHIIGYWLTKAYSHEEAREIILTLLADVQVLELNHDVTVLALHSKIMDIEDALQYHTALHHKMDAFITRDKQLQKTTSSTLPVLTPGEFLERFNNG